MPRLSRWSPLKLLSWLLTWPTYIAFSDKELRWDVEMPPYRLTRVNTHLVFAGTVGRKRGPEFSWWYLAGVKPLLPESFMSYLAALFPVFQLEATSLVEPHPHPLVLHLLVSS